MLHVPDVSVFSGEGRWSAPATQATLRAASVTRSQTSAVIPRRRSMPSARLNFSSCRARCSTRAINVGPSLESRFFERTGCDEAERIV